MLIDVRVILFMYCQDGAIKGSVVIQLNIMSLFDNITLEREKERK